MAPANGGYRLLGDRHGPIFLPSSIWLRVDGQGFGVWGIGIKGLGMWVIWVCWAWGLRLQSLRRTLSTEAAPKLGAQASSLSFKPLCELLSILAVFRDPLQLI